MLFYLFLAFSTYLLYYITTSIISLRQNIALAKSYGLPYVVIPFQEVGVVRSVLISIFILPILKVLPFSDRWLWVKFLEDRGHWKFLRELIDRLGFDHYVTVFPKGFHFECINAEICSQISARRTEFEKPTEMYKIVNIYGRNALTSDGPDWKRQRKIISPGFTEKNNASVWELGLTQAQRMLEYWAVQEGNSLEEMKIQDTAKDTATLALHVICGAGFGIPQLWPHEDESILGDKAVAGFNTKNPAAGRKLTFKQALTYSTSLQIAWLAVFPEWVLTNSPFQIHKKLISARDDCLFYLKELVEQKRNYRRLGFEQDATDLISPLIKASDDAERARDDEKDGRRDQGLTEEEITGNTFVIMFAGHETSANVLHFSFLYLAINLSAQEHLQSDIDEIVGSRPSSSWKYQVEMRRLFNSMVGGVLHETLRLLPPVIHVPKINKGAPKQVTVDGRTITIPGNNTYVHLETVTMNRSPRYFPHSPSKVTSCSHDLDDFVPERWLQDTPDTSSGDRSDKQVDGMEVASFEVNGSLFRPVKGAWMPFSEGPRACPGRRFAEVEVIAVLSFIFKQYSVELDVRTWASDDELEKMSTQEKRDVYAKAQNRAKGLIRGSISTFTLKMEGDPVPVRFMRRGKERFAGMGI